MTRDSCVIKWQTDAFYMEFVQNANGVICFHRVLPAGAKDPESATTRFQSSDLPLVNIKLAGEGNTKDKTSRSLISGYLSARLKYKSHQISQDEESETLVIVSIDESTNISVSVCLTVFGVVPVVRSVATVTNESNEDIVITQLSSLTVGGIGVQSERWFDDYTLWTATNSWFREAMWQEHKLGDLGIDGNSIRDYTPHAGSHATYTLGNRGSFSTGSHLPMGLLKSKDGLDSWLWQVEHNGSWRWEIGDFKDSIYLAAGGPTGVDHDWKHVLHPGESFTTVPVALAHVEGGLEQAFAALTDYRRRIIRPHEDNARLPIIFNDYMNCLMGDPDEEKILALLEPVAQTGAEYFVIDAGWYADDGNWWDDVGLWEPSTKRFPSGFKNLLDKIRSRGLIPGAWIEPEVIGVRSVMAERLPGDAFFQEYGKRVCERGRYQLDYRHPEVITQMNKVIHNLVMNYGIGYFKFDYNIEVVQGTDVGGVAPGVAHLAHQRAYLNWVRSLLDNYPSLVIESCSSGAQRMDYAMLSVHQLQSTSDQQNPALYAAISAAIPTAVLPEQSASWAYPQGEWDDELNALTVVNSLLGRVYLSGRLDHLKPDQMSLIKEGMDVYKTIRSDLKDSHPVWPLGLPRWHDDWVSLGLATAENGIYLAIWRRGGATEIQLLLNRERSSELRDERRVDLLYPTRFQTEYRWDGSAEVLHVTLPNTLCARLFHIR